MSDEIKPEEVKQEQIVAQVKIPRILLEIFVYGIKEDNVKIKKLTDNIQNQLAKPKLENKTRILYYVDAGEKTVEEKKQWLIDNCKCKYYIFANCETYTAKPDFVKNILFQIRKMDTILKGSKDMGIFVSKNKPKPEEVTDSAEVIVQENSPLSVVK